MQIQTWLKSASAQLKQVGIESAQLDSLLLIEHELDVSREWILAHEEHKLSTAQLTNLNKNITRRLDHVPVAYIINQKEFYQRTFHVNKDVLIPRPESESMIELLSQVIKAQQTNTVIDVGTGSGCLAITAKLLFPDVHVTGIDNSEAALIVAKKNARRHRVQIQFRKQDIHEGLPAMPKTRPYILLANLPYVPSSLITSPEITKEPPEALFSGEDGLDHYRVLWQQITHAKNKPIFVITESLETQHQQMATLAKGAGYNLQVTDTLAQLFNITE